MFKIGGVVPASITKQASKLHHLLHSA